MASRAGSGAGTQNTSNNGMTNPFGEISSLEMGFRNAAQNPRRNPLRSNGFGSTNSDWDSGNIWGSGGLPRTGSFDGPAADTDLRRESSFSGSNGIGSTTRKGSSFLLSNSESEGVNGRHDSQWPSLAAPVSRSNLSSNHVSPTRSRLLDNTTPLRQENGRSSSPYYSNSNSNSRPADAFSKALGTTNGLGSHTRPDAAFSLQQNNADGEVRQLYNTASFASNRNNASIRQELNSLRSESDFHQSNGAGLRNADSNSTRMPSSNFIQTQARPSGPAPYSHYSSGSLSALTSARSHSSNPSVQSLTNDLGHNLTESDADLTIQLNNLRLLNNNSRPQLDALGSQRPSFGSHASFDNPQSRTQHQHGLTWAGADNDEASFQLPHNYQNASPMTENSFRAPGQLSPQNYQKSPPIMENAAREPAINHHRDRNANYKADIDHLGRPNGTFNFDSSLPSNDPHMPLSSGQANTIGRRAGRHIAPVPLDPQAYPMNQSNAHLQYPYPYDMPTQVPLGVNPGLNYFQQPSNVYPGVPGLAMISRYRTADQDSNQRDRSPLLSSFRATFKTKDWNLKDIYGHFVEFCSDQHASRMIQQKLEIANADDKEQIFKEIIPEAYAVMTDIFGNYVIQKLFEHGDMPQKKRLALCMKGHVYKLTKQTYGCRVVQKALEHVRNDLKASLIHELDRDVIDCVKDQNGNHVIQKAIEMAPSEHLDAIIHSVLKDVRGLATDKFGCRVVQRMLEHCNDQVKQHMTRDLRPHIQNMITHQFGNYVIQNILTNGLDEDRRLVTEEVLANLLSYCKNKFASNVVEKALDHAPDDQREEIVKMLTTPSERGESPVIGLINDSFGNYVIQKVLKDLPLEARDRVCAEMRPYLTRIKRLNYGAKPIAAVERVIADLDHTDEKQNDRERDDDPKQISPSTSQSSSLLPSTNASTVEGPVHKDESSTYSDETIKPELQAMEQPSTLEAGSQNAFH